MRWIYLSPHFDDAVLSCGGLIYEQTRQGLQAEIWTIFAGDAPAGLLSPLALRCHVDWGIPDVHELVAARRDEDQAAAAIVGAEIVHFSLPDCIYRRSADGQSLYPDEVFVPFHPFDQGLDGDIAVVMAAELEADDILVVPLAIGDHVDHRLARLAAERLHRPLRYYADIPYVLRQPEATRDSGGVARLRKRRSRLRPPPRRGFANFIVAGSRRSLAGDQRFSEKLNQSLNRRGIELSYRDGQNRRLMVRAQRVY